MFRPSFLLADAAIGAGSLFFDPFRPSTCTGRAPFSRPGAYNAGFFDFRFLRIASPPAMDFPHPGSGPARCPDPSLPAGR